MKARRYDRGRWFVHEGPAAAVYAQCATWDSARDAAEKGKRFGFGRGRLPHHPVTIRDRSSGDVYERRLGRWHRRDAERAAEDRQAAIDAAQELHERIAP